MACEGRVCCGLPVDRFVKLQLKPMASSRHPDECFSARQKKFYTRMKDQMFTLEQLDLTFARSSLAITEFTQLQYSAG